MKYYTILFFIIASPIFVATKAQAANPLLHVGFIAPFSGSAQAYGDAARNGFEMALQANAQGRITVSYEDDQFTPSKTVTAFNKLTNIDKVDVIVCVGSSPCKAIASIAEAHKIPLIAWASDPTVALNRRYVVRSYPTGEAEGARSAEEALAKGFTNIGVVTATHDYIESWNSGVVPATPPELIVFKQEVPGDTTDFKPLILRAKQKGVENFLLCVLPGQVGMFAKQLRELGSKAKIGGCYFLEDENEARIAHGGLSGAWFITIPISDNFRKEYKKLYGNENALSAAAVHFDVANLLNIAVKDTKPVDLISALGAIGKYDGVGGMLSMQFGQGDQFFKYPLAPITIP